MNFSDGKGITTKVDGTIVLISQNVNGMYILEAIDPSLNVPFTMTSLSQPTSLEQWHRCFAHCSPSTIQDMVNNNLVDGGKIISVTNRTIASAYVLCHLTLLLSLFQKYRMEIFNSIEDEIQETTIREE